MCRCVNESSQGGRPDHTDVLSAERSFSVRSDVWQPCRKLNSLYTLRQRCTRLLISQCMQRHDRHNQAFIIRPLHLPGSCFLTRTSTTRLISLSRNNTITHLSAVFSPSDLDSLSADSVWRIFKPSVFSVFALFWPPPAPEEIHYITKSIQSPVRIFKSGVPVTSMATGV